LPEFSERDGDRRDRADNAAVEWGFPVNPNYQRKAFGFLGLPLHVDFIWNRGAYIMEILNLDELARIRRTSSCRAWPAAAQRRDRRTD